MEDAAVLVVVAFDIETLGLMVDGAPLPEITCVCLFDGVEETALRLWGLSPVERDANVARIIARLDAADTLVGYNAVAFDLEFMRRAFAIDDARVRAWHAKCIDPLVLLRLATRTTAKMQHMLELNGLGSKTASGGDAIQMAREGAWDRLLAYCMMDARLVYALVRERTWLRLTAGGLEVCIDCSGRAAPRFRVVVTAEASSLPPPPITMEMALPEIAL